MPKIQDWAPYNDHVQGGLKEGQFLNGQFILIGAGPPFWSQIGNAGGDGEAASTAIYPIGLTQNFALAQNKAISRIFEIGSDRSYFISGRSVGQLSLGRVVYHGPSLLRTLYAWYNDGDNIPAVASENDALTYLPNWIPGGNGAVESKQNHAVQIPPGHDNMFLNLASDLFSQPLGLYLKFKDNNDNTVAEVYLEQCYIPQHSLAVDSQGLIVQEQVGVQYERMIPIKNTQLGLLDTKTLATAKEAGTDGWKDVTGLKDGYPGWTATTMTGSGG